MQAGGGGLGGEGRKRGPRSCIVYAVPWYSSRNDSCHLFCSRWFGVHSRPLAFPRVGNKMPNSTDRRPINEMASHRARPLDIKTLRHNPTSPGGCRWKPKPPSRMPIISGSLTRDFGTSAPHLRLGTDLEPASQPVNRNGIPAQTSSLFALRPSPLNAHHSSHSHGITMFHQEGHNTWKSMSSSGRLATQAPSLSGSSSCHPHHTLPLASSSKPPRPSLVSVSRRRDCSPCWVPASPSPQSWLPWTQLNITPIYPSPLVTPIRLPFLSPPSGSP